MLRLIPCQRTQQNTETSDVPLDEVIHAAELLVRAILVATQQTEVMLQLAGVGGDRESTREPFLRHLAPPFLVRVELHEASGFLTDRRNVLDVQSCGASYCIRTKRHLCLR